METLRHRLHQLCFEKLNESISSAQQSIDEARDAQKQETKSSAGDKFETTREMMTQEIEKSNLLLEKLMAEKSRLTAIASREECKSVQQGNVARTNLGNFYLGISIGAISLDGIKFQTVSTSSPVGQAMLNKKKGERFLLHDKEYFIEEIL